MVAATGASLHHPAVAADLSAPGRRPGSRVASTAVWAPLTNGLIAAALVLAAVTAVLSLLRRATPGPVRYGVLVIGAGALLLAVVAVVRVAAGPRPEETGTFLVYALSVPLIVPAAWLWARVEPGRWGNGVLCAGCLTLAVMIVRMNDLWTLGG